MTTTTALLLISCLAATVAAYGQASRSRCWSSGSGQAARWWNEGERIDRGESVIAIATSSKYWYECRGGQLDPRGCFADDGKRLAIGESFDMKGYMATCELGSDGYLEFRFSSCVSPDGRTRQPGETWSDPKNTYYYTCAKDGSFLRMKVEGCMSHDKQSKLRIGEKYDHGDYTYECQQKTNGNVQMCSVGCIHEGQHYKVGQQWPEGDFIFYCKMNGGRCQKKCIGCLYQGKSLYDGDRYRKDDSVYQCEIRADSYGHKPVGCVSRDTDGSAVERVIGCRWYLSTTESKIEQTCEMDGAKTKVNTVGCIYRHNGFDTIFLDPSTFTIWNPPRQSQAVGLACRPQANGAVLDTFSIDQLPSRTAGMKYTQPRGK